MQISLTSSSFYFKGLRRGSGYIQNIVVETIYAIYASSIIVCVYISYSCSIVYVHFFILCVYVCKDF